MLKWLVVIAMVLGGYYFFFSDSRKSSKMIETTETLTLTKGGVKIVYGKKQPLTESYMIFGVGNFSGDLPIDSYILGIPSDAAKSLLQQYPDLTKCNSKGSTAAKKAIHQLFTINGSDEVKRVLKEAKIQFDEAIRADGSRFCLRVQGRELEVKDVYHRDERVDSGVQIDGKLIHVENVALESCGL
ncbi:MAG: hypothetical protein FWC42_03525 [Proteobacteria bacterium]|nr:hypothetical protein [Pseudomonadota bacterium]